MLNATNAALLWNPGTAQVAVRPLEDPGTEFDRSGLGCYAVVRKMDFEQRKAHVFIEAMHLIIRDRCDPQAVHAALWALEEYRDGCAPDMPGSPRAST